MSLDSIQDCITTLVRTMKPPSNTDLTHLLIRTLLADKDDRTLTRATPSSTRKEAPCDVPISAEAMNMITKAVQEFKTMRQNMSARQKIQILEKQLKPALETKSPTVKSLRDLSAMPSVPVMHIVRVFYYGTKEEKQKKRRLKQLAQSNSSSNSSSVKPSPTTSPSKKRVIVYVRDHDVVYYAACVHRSDSQNPSPYDKKRELDTALHRLVTCPVSVKVGAHETESQIMSILSRSIFSKGVQGPRWKSTP